MATLYDYYTPTDNYDGTDGIRDNIWIYQTFTASDTYTITSVILKLYRYNTNPGTVTVSIRATSGGKPTEGDLCSGTTDGNTLAAGSPYTLREISFGSGATLTAGTMYAIVVRALTATAFHYIIWRAHSGSVYAGTYGKSTDSGVSWNLISGVDAWFQTYSSVSLYDEGTVSVSGDGVVVLLNNIQSMIETTKSLSATGSIVETDSKGFSEPTSFIIFEGHILPLTETYDPWVWGHTKVSTYNPNKTYDEVTQTWIAPNGKGGGRFKTALLVIAQADDSDNGLLLFNVD